MKVFEIRCEVQGEVKWVGIRAHEHYYIVAAESEEAAIRRIVKKNNRFGHIVENTIRINEFTEETVLYHVDETYEQEKYEMEHDDYDYGDD